MRFSLYLEPPNNRQPERRKQAKHYFRITQIYTIFASVPDHGTKQNLSDMPGATTKATNREKAAILMIAAGILDDWTEAYFIAEDKSRKDCDLVKFPAASVSRWKTSDKVKNILSDYQRIFADRYAEERQKGREEARRMMEEGASASPAVDSVRTETEKQKPVARVIDYSDPANQAKKLNELVNQASDPGEALDALKVIISTQKADKEAAREKKTVQFYRPLRCDQCPLYEKAKKKL